MGLLALSGHFLRVRTFSEYPLKVSGQKHYHINENGHLRPRSNPPPKAGFFVLGQSWPRQTLKPARHRLDYGSIPYCSTIFSYCGPPLTFRVFYPNKTCSGRTDNSPTLTAVAPLCKKSSVSNPASMAK